MFRERPNPSNCPDGDFPHLLRPQPTLLLSLGGGVVRHHRLCEGLTSSALFSLASNSRRRLFCMFAVTVVVVGHSLPEVRLLKRVSVYSSSHNESLPSRMIWQKLRCCQESRSTNSSNTRGLHWQLMPHNSLRRIHQVNIPHSTSLPLTTW